MGVTRRGASSRCASSCCARRPNYAAAGILRAVRTEVNVSLASLFGLTAVGSDDERSDVELPDALSGSDDVLRV
jgi:hypothetical protein